MNYDKIDFNELYKIQKQSSTFKMKSKSDWDKKSKTTNLKVHKSIYNTEFINLLDTSECKTLLDVGCGVGNLSLKLASKLEDIYCLDYSSGMLDTLEQNAKQQNITNIKIINNSWYDSWKEIPKTDIVIASRSMEVVDMKDAILKLDNQAKKRVYISYRVGGSFLSDDILNAMQRKIVKKPDYIYLVNILYQMGINAKIDFVRSESGNIVYDTLEGFLNSIKWSIGEISEEEIERLKEFYENKKNKNSNNYIKWAVISWDKEG